MKTTAEQRAYIRRLLARTTPGRLRDTPRRAKATIATVDLVGDLLDDLEEVTAERDHLAASRDLEQMMEHVALSIAKRDARTIAALESERDVLATKLDRVRALATEWAGQPTDWDEDTAQQISDGRAILDILDADGGES